MATKILGCRKYSVTDEVTKRVNEGFTFYLGKTIEPNQKGEIVGHGIDFPKINKVSVSNAKLKDVLSGIDPYKLVDKEVVISFDENQKPIKIDLLKQG